MPAAGRRRGARGVQPCRSPPLQSASLSSLFKRLPGACHAATGLRRSLVQRTSPTSAAARSRSWPCRRPQPRPAALSSPVQEATRRVRAGRCVAQRPEVRPLAGLSSSARAPSAMITSAALPPGCWLARHSARGGAAAHGPVGARARIRDQLAPHLLHARRSRSDISGARATQHTKKGKRTGEGAHLTCRLCCSLPSAFAVTTLRSSARTRAAGPAAARSRLRSARKRPPAGGTPAACTQVAAAPSTQRISPAHGAFSAFSSCKPACATCCSVGWRVQAITAE